MSVVNAVAKPRYPWNGKVDIDCEVRGESGHDYAITLEARDLDGGTNLPLRTAWQVGGAITNNIFLVQPGTYRFTWNADADIAGDGDFPNVAVSVSAEGSAIIAATKVLPLEVAGYTGTEILTNVPVLVRLSTAIAGFSYADFADADGGDLIFTDENGSVVYPHEIDEWHTDGESLVWVRLPQMANGTRFKAAWGTDGGTPPEPPSAVWSDYAGVWHFNEDSGTAFDSTAHGLDALPSKGTNTLADISQMVAYENGACGRARVNSLKLAGTGNYQHNYMLVPAYDGLALDQNFVVSGWFNGEYWNNGSGTYPRLFSRKSVNYDDPGGWEITYLDTYLTVSDDDGTGGRYSIPSLSQGWVQIVIAYEGLNCACYTNGVSCVELSLTSGPSDNGVGLSFGNTTTGSRWSFVGQYDEIRLREGSLSADRIKADYDMIKNRNFLGYGPVENGKGVAE